MSEILGSIREEVLRYKGLAEAAMEQLSEDELSTMGPGSTNSVAVIAWHLGGNLASRFTDFLHSDGEKPWRNRDEEFVSREVSREALLDHWNRGWSILLATLDELTDQDLTRTVTIRSVALPVHAALHRSLAHASYHVGQIVHSARALRGDRWTFLSIPPGRSQSYNQNPVNERGDAHASRLSEPDIPPRRP
jgi:hypothetical protein